MATINDLTTLQLVKSYLNTDSTITDGDAEYSAMISRASAKVLTWLNRPTLLSTSYNEWYDGSGKNRIILRNYPVTAITLLQINGQPTTAASTSWPTGSGYFLEPWNGIPPGRAQALYVNGNCFYKGLANINVVSVAGYRVSSEAATVPASSSYNVTVASPLGMFARDEGVVYAATGVALVKVASNPTAGQYVAGVAGTGTYTFAAGDAGSSVLISYSYVPTSVQGAVTEWVAERIKYRDRIGQRSKTMGGQETTAFEIVDCPDYIKSELQPFRRVTPI